MRLSSKYTSTDLSKYGLSTSFIKAWKAEGALVNPKGVTRNLCWPYLVLKAVFGTSFGSTRTCQCPDFKSIFENIFARLNWSKDSSNRDKGYPFFFCNSVQGSVVHTHAKCPVFLPNKQHRRTPGRCRRLYHTFLG